MNGYICFYKGKRTEVYAETAYEARLKAAEFFKARKSYEVIVESPTTREASTTRGGGLMTRKAYNVVFTYSVLIWAESREDAEDEASLFAADEARLGSAFDKMDFSVIVESVDPDLVPPSMFINEEGE